MGTRLRPITEKIPKCLVPIKGKPLLGIWLDTLSSLGVTEILVNTHYLSEQVNDYVKKSVYSSMVSLVYEEVLLGTAGTILKNKDFFSGDEGLIIHADNYFMGGLSGFIAAHKNRPKKTVMSLLIS